MKWRRFVVFMLLMLLLAAVPLLRALFPKRSELNKLESNRPRRKNRAARRSMRSGGTLRSTASRLKGDKTACGGRYNPTQLLAAHPKLRCGTRVRVTNLRNGETVRVTINDRGPLSHNRVIDLSYAAARRLDFIKQGTTLVKVEVIR